MRLDQTEMAKTAFLPKVAGFFGRHTKVHFEIQDTIITVIKVVLLGIIKAEGIEDSIVLKRIGFHNVLR